MSILCVECDDPAEIAPYYEAGADELIFALKHAAFTSIRTYSAEDIISLIPLVHGNHMRISVLMNRLFSENEIIEQEENLEKLTAAGADAVIFADPALMQVSECISKMIYRPETLLTSSYDAAWWMKMGLQSAVISPILTKEEILHMADCVKNLSMPVHGRFIMSISRRRLLHAYAEETRKENLSGKTSLSLQEEKREGHMPVFENEEGTIIFTDFVQQSFRYVHAFLKHGIERFEIEAEYLDSANIKDTLKIYRQLLDGDMPDTKSYFEKYSLPFSEGYLSEKTIR